MHQLTQTLKSGAMQVLQVPFPALDPGAVLVRNHFSIISVGTEGRTVRDARAGYLGKARARQKEVRQVLESVHVKGLRSTYRAVMNKLDAPSSLGYSTAGVVMAVGSEITEFAVGDRVACAGSTAVHAEVIAVPRNLCVKVPAGLELREAAFATIGAIALQGVRQAELGVGSNCVVIGLGLVGLLSAQLLDAAGVRAIGIDIDPLAAARAQTSGLPLAIARDTPDLEAVVARFSRGRGADAVLIAAATASTDPVDLAGRLCRAKARVVIVGNVPTGFAREPYYRKELDLRMSCSYGPGRHDPMYEEQGIDYPVGYVRWTEARNMEAFLDLAAAGKLNLPAVTSHEFALADAGTAYQMIVDKSEPFVGIRLRYDVETPLSRRVDLAPVSPTGQSPRVGLLGAGAFAQNVLLPLLKDSATLVGVATSRPNNARHVADRYGFAYCTGDADDILADVQVNTVFVLTRHNLHAAYVLKALRAGKNVFVEKPLCLTPGELEEIRHEAESRECRIMVGFNRRFSPLVARIREQFPPGTPKAINYRINAGILPPDHWVHDPEIGGGRILGEVCHFVDLARFLVGAPIESVAATVAGNGQGLRDSVSISLGYSDGSIASIAYFSNGTTRVGKEWLELFSGGCVAVLDDFRELRIHGGKEVRVRLRTPDKGHRAEIEAFVSAVREGRPSPISFAEIYESTDATFRVIESIRTRQMISV